jgi:hypothetical protein
MLVWNYFVRASILLCVQVMQLEVILTSLGENEHVAKLLGFTGSTRGCLADSSFQVHRPSVDHRNLPLSERLMETLLRNLTSHAVSSTFCIKISHVFSYGLLVFATASDSIHSRHHEAEMWH